MRVIYLPLESYQERYTELLTKWTCSRFAQYRLDVTVIEGQRLGGAIKVGQVLDAYGRSYWSLTQVAELMKHLAEGDFDEETIIYFDDMFTPGYEALPYMLEQRKEKAPKIVVRNHAQSVDPDDFVFPMRSWMRHFEHAVYNTANAIVCASTVHKEAMEIAMLDGNVHVLGLPYDKHDVFSRGPAPGVAVKRPQVIFSSRFDREKQPHFFLDVVKEVRHTRPDIDFVVCTGSKEVRSNDPSAVARLASSNVRVEKNCTKQDYYYELACSAVQLNTARQDYVSYTAIEASTFGVPTLAPAFRSFPEALRNRERVLYVPWSVKECASKLIELVDHGDDPKETAWLADDQHATLDRIVQLFKDEISNRP